MYDLGNSRALRGDLAKFAVMLTSFIHSKRTRKELNESREDFIGTRVVMPQKKKSPKSDASK